VGFQNLLVQPGSYAICTYIAVSCGRTKPGETSPETNKIFESRAILT